MKVLFCHDGPIRKDEFNNFYGTAHNDDTFRRYYNIADELSVAIRVKKISKSEAEKKLSKITVAPFEVVECPNVSSIKGMLLQRQKTKRILKEAVLKSDYVVARLPSIMGFIGIDLARELKKPYLVEVVACPWDAFWNHSLKGRLIAPFMHFITKEQVKNASYVVYVTEEFLQSRYPNKGRHIGCSDVSLPNLGDSILKRRIEKINSVNLGSPVVLGTTAALDVRYKGQEYVIKAISKLNKEGFNFEYHLVGGGDNSYLKFVAKKCGVEDKIKFLGSLSHEKVFDYLDSIDIYIQPSKVEGLPRALVEAMSRACPTVGSAIGGIPELISNRNLFTEGSVNGIYDLLSKMDKNLMMQEAKINFERAKEFDKKLLNGKRNSFYMEFKETLG